MSQSVWDAHLAAVLVPPPLRGRSPTDSPLLVEAKATRTVRPEMAEPMLRLAAAMRERSGRAPRCLVVHEGPALATRALAPGAEAVDLARLLEVVGGTG